MATVPGVLMTNARASRGPRVATEPYANRGSRPARPGRARSRAARGLRRRALRSAATRPYRARWCPTRGSAACSHIDPDRHTPARRPPGHRPRRAARAAHPLGAVLPLLRSTLVSIADEAVHVMIVTDADGTILWREGAPQPAARGRLGRAGPGPALVRGRGRHERDGHRARRRRARADPLRRAPRAHGPLLDLRGRARPTPTPAPDRRHRHQRSAAHRAPAMVQLVAATAQLAENQLRVRLAIADEQLRIRNMPHLASLRGRPARWSRRRAGSWPASRTPGGRSACGSSRVSDRVRLDDGREMAVEPLAEGYLLRATTPTAAPARRRALSLRFLGDHPSVLLDGTPVPVTLRPAELLAALALHPDGLTAERLAMLLYGDDGNPTTVRGEVLRLRALIGSDVLRTRPYRLDATVDTDFGTVRRALAPASPPRRCERARVRCCPARTPRRSARSATPWWPACAGRCWRRTRRTCWPTTPRTPGPRRPRGARPAGRPHGPARPPPPPLLRPPRPPARRRRA